MQQLKDEEQDHPLIDGMKGKEWNKELDQKSDHLANLSTDDLCLGKEHSHDITIEDLTEELESIALDWKSVRTATECPCSTPLDFSSFKVRLQYLEF